MDDNVRELPVPDEVRRRLRDRDTLPNGGGGGNFDGMEPRIAKLEAHMEQARSDITEVKRDMRDVRERLIRLDERVNHLPTKGFIVTSLMAALALITAVVAFQDKITALIH